MLLFRKSLLRFVESLLFEDQLIYTSFNHADSSIMVKVLKVPKSNVGVIRGVKAREKTLSITDLNITQGSEEAFLQEATEKLIKAVKKSHSK